MPPHAIHGVAYDRPWRIDDDRTLSIDLDERWPFRGRVVQRFALTESSMSFELALEAAEPMPATIGWHPWFRRVLEPGDAPVELAFEADSMLVRDAAGMPSGRVASPPPPPPWDDAFTGVHADPVLTWPGRLRLSVGSSCSWWVVYTEPPTSICVEPQSGPPDAVNGTPEVVEPGAPLVHTMRWTWERALAGEQLRRQQVAQLPLARDHAPAGDVDRARSRPCASGSRAGRPARRADPRSPGRGRRGTAARTGPPTPGSRSRPPRPAALRAARPRRRARRAPRRRSPPSGSPAAAAR